MASPDPMPQRPSRKIIWIAGGVVLLAIVIAALWGVGLGAGGALGVSGAAPSGDNATPSPSAATGSVTPGTNP